MNFESMIIQMIGNHKNKRNYIAQVYQEGIYLSAIDSEKINWTKINKTIIQRWSILGLKYIKKLAWRQLKK